MGKKAKYQIWNDRVSVQPFNWDLFIVTPSSLAAFEKHMKVSGFSKKKRKEIISTFDEVFRDGGAMFHSGQVLVLAEEWNEKQVWHEALHTAIGFWQDAGAQLALEANQEVLTYTQGHIVDLVREFYAKRASRCQSKK